MNMNDARLLAVIAQCFGPASEQDWNAATGTDEWDAFRSRLRLLLSGAALLGNGAAPSLRKYRTEPLQESLAEPEVRALFTPPSYEQKRSFAARHFTGGLPHSAVPVESLYVEWTNDPARGPFAQRTGLYQAETALYMAELFGMLGVELPKSLAVYPDHLALELEAVSILLDAGCIDDARQLFAERTEWLTAYRQRLVKLGADALFYLALVDALLGIRAALLAQGNAYEEGFTEGRQRASA